MSVDKIVHYINKLGSEAIEGEIKDRLGNVVETSCRFEALAYILWNQATGYIDYDPLYPKSEIHHKPDNKVAMLLMDRSDGKVPNVIINSDKDDKGPKASERVRDLATDREDALKTANEALKLAE